MFNFIRTYLSLLPGHSRCHSQSFSVQGSRALFQWPWRDLQWMPMIFKMKILTKTVAWGMRLGIKFSLRRTITWVGRVLYGAGSGEDPWAEGMREEVRMPQKDKNQSRSLCWLLRKNKRRNFRNQRAGKCEGKNKINADTSTGQGGGAYRLNLK